MDSKEYAQWETDAKRALEGRYTTEEIEVILSWFRSIKGAGEVELIGQAEVEAMSLFIGARENFDLYNSLMARLFIYAPLILREDGCVASLETFARLKSDMHRFADQVREASDGYSKMWDSREFEKLTRACRNVVAAGKGKVQTTEEEFVSLVREWCMLVARPSHAVYAGDLQYLISASNKLHEAYKEALSAATAA